MAFSKRFPRDVPGSSYPIWEEIQLTDEEEKIIEEDARKRNIAILSESIVDARRIVESNRLKGFQNDLVELAVALFGKRASHEVYWKEEACKDKFDRKF